MLHVCFVEVQTSEEVKTDSESNDKKSELNPNAQEFRPRTKRNTPSPVSKTMKLLREKGEIF